MALIKLTAFLDNISGKLNGTVFASNKGGHYVRSKSKPSNPKTASQMAVRSVFGSVSQAWRALTQAERQSWNGATPDYKYTNRLGDQKTLSGFALHQKLNTNLALIGQPLLNTAPAKQNVVGVEGIVSVNPGATKFTIGAKLASDPQVATRYMVFATPVISAGVDNFENQLRYIGLYEAEGQLADLDIFDEYSAKFGAPVAGGKYGVGVKPVHMTTGQEGVMITEFAFAGV